MKVVLALLIMMVLLGSCTPRLPYAIGGGTEGYETFLPIVMAFRYEYKELYPIGIHMQVVKINEIEYIVPHTTAILELFWSRTELIPNEYTWDSEYENIVKELQNKNVRVLFRAKNSPEWARVHKEYECSEPKEEYYNNYARFIVEAAYHFNVSTFLIWNEPVSYPGTMLPPNDHYFGCWGNSREAGRRYGNLVKEVYREISKQSYKIMILPGEVCCNAYKEFVPGMVDILGELPDLSYHSYYVKEGNMPEVAINDYYRYRMFANNLYLTEMNMIGKDGSSKEYCLSIEQEQANWLRKIIPEIFAKDIKFIGIYAIRSWWRCADLVKGTRKTPEWFVYSRNGE